MPFGARHHAIFAFCWVGTALLAGCDFFSSSSKPSTPLPVQLQPEIDAFADDSVRVYTWTEGLSRSGRDSTLRQATYLVHDDGDTVVNDSSQVRLRLTPSTSLPAGAVTSLGFNANHVRVDTTVLPDPGAAMAFPQYPHIGWSGEWTSGELRFVRKLTGTATLAQSGIRVQCWAFAESTYRADELLSTGTAWVGAKGLVRHRTQWAGYSPSTGAGATLWREVQAL